MTELETRLLSEGFRLNTAGQDRNGTWHCSIRTYRKDKPDFWTGQQFEYLLGHGKSLMEAFEAALASSQAEKLPPITRRRVEINLDDLEL